jgi:hypothetical protein
MNNMSDDKKFTWGQLREFCNSLSEEQLSFPVMVAAVDGLDFSEYVTPVISPPMYGTLMIMMMFFMRGISFLEKNQVK